MVDNGRWSVVGIGWVLVVGIGRWTVVRVGQALRSHVLLANVALYLPVHGLAPLTDGRASLSKNNILLNLIAFAFAFCWQASRRVVMRESGQEE